MRGILNFENWAVLNLISKGGRMVERRESKTMINNKMRDMDMDNKMKANNKMKDMEMDLLKNAEFKEAFDEFDQVILCSI